MWKINKLAILVLRIILCKLYHESAQEILW
jgi:hypothetical protein